MKTKLKTIHEEQYSDKSKTLGVLLNYSYDEDYEWKDSLLYVFNHERTMYTFFETIIDMIDYLLYGEDKKKRAYMSEEIFDKYFDAEYIDGEFNEKLKWL